MDDSLKWMKVLADDAWEKACWAIALGFFSPTVLVVRDKGEKVNIVPGTSNTVFETPEMEKAFFEALWMAARKEKVDGIMLITEGWSVPEKRDDSILPPSVSPNRKEMLVVTLCDGYGVTYGRAGMVARNEIGAYLVEEIAPDTSFDWAMPAIRPWKEPKLIH